MHNRTPAAHGDKDKRTGSYFNLVSVFRHYLGAYATEAGKPFELLVGTYLGSNGNSPPHNFSPLQPHGGGYVIATAHGLL